MQILGLIPAYNESASVGAVIDSTIPFVDEVVVIDDASSDGTGEIGREHGATVISHAVNVGVGGALRTGYRYAIRNGYDVVVQIDGDGQHDPSYIPELLASLESNDVVIGSRYLNDSIRDYSPLRRLGIRFFTEAVNRLSQSEITDVTSGYRVYRTSVLRDIIHQSDKHWAVEQTLEAAKSGLQIEEVSVEMPTRSSGNSQFDVETFVMYPIRMTDIIFRILVFR